MRQPLFQQVTIVGTGFIGGAIGLAAKAKGLVDVVVGTDTNREAIDQALAACAIDRGSTDFFFGGQGCIASYSRVTSRDL